MTKIRTPTHSPYDPSLAEKMAADAEAQDLAHRLFLLSCKYRYSYNFSWLGRPIIQYPQDMVAIQEIVWRVQPTLIVETGIAHGGSLVFSASLLEMLGGQRRVVGIDIEIREHNRIAIAGHPLAGRITMIEGSSIDRNVAASVARIADKERSVMVVLDSNHTHEHVLQELEIYSPLVTPGSYLIVLDTVIDDMPDEFFPNRPWGPGNNPKTAVREFLKKDRRFEVDREIERKLLLTVAPEGYLRRVES
jgi:cephalosporin hydroxylase